MPDTIKILGFAAEPEKDETSRNYIFRLKLSGITSPTWDNFFREACEEVKSNPIPANAGLDRITIRCGVVDFEDNYFARIKAAVEYANSESERSYAEKKREVSAKTQQIKADRERLVGLKERLKF